ncbi:hypothetical protein [Duncaniella dubosii]|uniref:hypothetical protein n=1 Tax=Duncaniella dubosii TaxID=2518971 RepID=UPI0023F30C80|nr:hypothetical protein [Duncaniella dubosii]
MARFHSAVNPKPRLAIPTCKDRHLLSVLQSARAAISLKSPTRQMIVMHGVQAVAILHLSPRAGMLPASIVLPTRNVAYAMAFDRSLRQSLASLSSPTPSIFGRGSAALRFG